MLAANNERQFADLCKVLGHSECVEDSRWAEPRARASNREALREIFETALLSKSAYEWEALLDQAGVPASRVRKLGETVAEGQLQARGLLKTLDVGEYETPVSLPGIGFRLNRASLTPDQPPRAVGANDAEWMSD